LISWLLLLLLFVRLLMATEAVASLLAAVAAGATHPTAVAEAAFLRCWSYVYLRQHW
jgi:hypothetical protein